jgi:DNA mismatch endonuclease (patch repair protein)
VPDVYDMATRSRVMAAVRSRDTAPELTVRRALHASGYRFRLHRQDFPGRPDIVLPKHRMAVFVHGCFWHGHECNRAKRPQTNVDYWDAKRERNRARDRRAQLELRRSGWRVAVIWTCQQEADTQRLLRRLRRAKSVVKGDAQTAT